MINFILGGPVLVAIIMVGAGWAGVDVAARRRLIASRTNRVRRRKGN